MSDVMKPMTTVIHAGNEADKHGAPFTPLYDTTTFSFENTMSLLDVVEGRRSGAFYTRYGMNPTITSLETRLAQLDAAESALAFASGMAAISSLCLAYGQQGIICIGDIYGGTAELLQKQCPQLGIRSQFLQAGEFDGLEQALAAGASLVFFETPTNPTLTVIDIEQVCALVHRYAAKVAVDNTFASPINQLPLALGADFSLQSATKYLGGHSDLTAGVVSGCHQDILLLQAWRKSLGQTISPEIAHKLKRSLVTLPLRIERHNDNAMMVAEFLQHHPAVVDVFYPGLPTDRGHAIASRQMMGFGGMLSFNVRAGIDAARVIDHLQLISIAPSLGGAETLATQPVTTSHYGVAEADLKTAGISAAMIRLSVGLEDSSDLLADLKQALAI